MRSLLVLSAVAGVALATAATAAPVGAAVAPPTQEEPYIVFTMGDSYASGEGAPDIDGAYDDAGQNPNPKEAWFPFRPVDHPDRIAAERCHRSGKSPSGVATRFLNEDFPDLQVEWQSVACSGASIVAGRVFNGPVGPDPGGILRSYRGQDRLRDFDPVPPLPAFPPQISQVDSILDSRRAGPRKRIDALLMNIGGNDIGFASFVSYCANVISTTDQDCHTIDDLEEFRENNLDLLPGRYDRLAAAINGDPLPNSNDPALGYRPAAVIMTAVPDVARNSSSGFCDQAPAGQHEDKVERAESEWLETQVKIPLNDAIRGATEDNGWEIADQAVSDFRGHSICNTDRWINTLRDSLRKQGEDVIEGIGVPFVDFSSGWVHPNERGYAQTGGALYEKLAAKAVERFTPTQGPTLSAIQRANGFTIRALPPASPSTTAGVYQAMKPLRMDANGNLSNVPGHTTPRLLEYGVTTSDYPGLTGRFVLEARTCGPLSRDASIGCGPASALRVSTERPATPVNVGGGTVRTLFGNTRFLISWAHANVLAEHDTQFSRVSISEVGRSARDGGFSTTIRVDGRATTLTDVPGIQSSKRYTVRVQACNSAGIGCSAQSAPVEIEARGARALPTTLSATQLEQLDPNRSLIAGPARPCPRIPRAFNGGSPAPVLPERPGTRGPIELPDTNGLTVPFCPGDPPVGDLVLSPRNARARAGRPVNLTMGWQHPRRWGELETVTLRLRKGRRVLGTVTFDQEKHTIRARGVRVASGTIKQPPRRTRAIKIKLRVTLPRSAAGSVVLAEMAGRGDDGTSQPFAPAGTIRVR